MSDAPFQQLDRTVGFPYSRGEYARRFCWRAVECSLVRFSPGRAFGWRRFWLKLFGAKLAPTARTRPTTRVFHPWLLTLGEHSILADGVDCYNLGEVVVGDHTVVSQGARLCAGNHDYSKPDLPLLRPTITIGSGVWVCTEAFVGPGVTVGDNTVVTARSVVTRDLPAGVVAGGHPAEVRRDRPMGAGDEQRTA